MKLRAYAKVNLFLEVIGRGNLQGKTYHRIQTIYQTVGLFDDIIVTAKKDPGLEVFCEYPSLPSGRGNLVYKAAELLKHHAGVKQGARINVIKRIPVGAGLGGGSSDAAAVVVGLSKLWRLNYSRRTLASICFKVGCDVPFFLYGHTALGEGYGEIVTPLPKIKRRWVLLVKPNFMLSTDWVYKQLDKIWLTEPKNIITIKTRHLPKRFTRIPSITLGDIRDMLEGNEGLEKLAYNRLENVVQRYYPVIGKIKEILKEGGAEVVLMSGSGPTVFAFLRDKATGERLQERLAGENFSTWLVTTV